ncbi:Transposon TX1 uncharacterized 149 kDa protein [Linum perenne]
MALVKPDLVILMEPRISGPTAEKVVKKLGFDSQIIEEAQGFSSGLWLLWNKANCGIIEIGRSSQSIQVEISMEDLPTCRLSAVYARPNAASRALLWDELRLIASTMQLPWGIIGDFNCVLAEEDKAGGAAFSPYRAESFRQWVGDCGLVDLGFSGPPYTWFRGRLRERIDRAFGSASWVSAFPEGGVRHIMRIRSDHRPIVLNSHAAPIPRIGARPFRFLAPWIGHPDFDQLIKANWSRERGVCKNLEKLTWKLRKWNSEVFGWIHNKKLAIQAQLGELEEYANRVLTPEAIIEAAKCRRQFESVLWDEELLWIQKSRSNSIRLGDRNTHYFHTLTLKRRGANKIISLRNDDGRWIEDPSELKSMALAYFVNIFQDPDGGLIDLGSGFVGIDASVAKKLVAPPQMEEVKAALMSMGKLKAPGRDGFHPLFYQHSWETVGGSVTKFVSECFSNPNLISSVNDTLLVLLPKVRRPKNMSQLRPISLCNVLYKLVMKCLTNRLRPLMNKLIISNQSSFVPGR